MSERYQQVAEDMSESENRGNEDETEHGEEENVERNDEAQYAWQREQRVKIPGQTLEEHNLRQAREERFKREVEARRGAGERSKNEEQERAKRRTMGELKSNGCVKHSARKKSTHFLWRRSKPRRKNVNFRQVARKRS